MARELDAGHAWHPDVEQSDRRAQLAGERQRVDAGRAFGRDRPARQLLDETAQALAGGLLVVDDQNLEGLRGHSVYGKRIVTRYSPGGRSIVSAAAWS